MNELMTDPSSGGRPGEGDDAAADGAAQNLIFHHAGTGERKNRRGCGGVGRGRSIRVSLDPSFVHVSLDCSFVHVSLDRSFVHVSLDCSFVHVSLVRSFPRLSDSSTVLVVRARGSTRPDI